MGRSAVRDTTMSAVQSSAVARMSDGLLSRGRQFTSGCLTECLHIEISFNTISIRVKRTRLTVIVISPRAKINARPIICLRCLFLLIIGRRKKGMVNTKI